MLLKHLVYSLRLWMTTINQDFKIRSAHLAYQSVRRFGVTPSQQPITVNMFPTPSKKGSGALVKEKNFFLRSQDVRMSKAKNENVSAAQKEITLER